MKFSKEAYRRRLQELFLRFPSVQKDGFSGGAYKAGLEGMRRLDTVLGHPHESYPTVHIAGTNGKGSVSSMIAASLAASGLRTGLYTSPHLKDFRERIKIIEVSSSLCLAAEQLITEEAVWEFLEENEKDLKGLSFFEITTGMGLWWFRKQKVDIAVIEVGLGGLLDSTNIITPKVSVVTSIALDHCALLGSTRELIARQKAGIFKSGVPAVVGCADARIKPTFEQEAAKVGCPLIYAAGTAAGISGAPTPQELDLRGEYQKDNLDTALCALQAAGLPICPEGIRKAAALTGLHGRWEILSREPLTIADIGHNPAALKLNFRQLEELGRPMTIVYGIMADKDLDSIIPMMPAEAGYILCAPDTPRALSADKLQERIREKRPELKTETAASVELAVKKARETAGPESVIYIGGSAFVVAQAL